MVGKLSLIANLFEVYETFSLCGKFRKLHFPGVSVNHIRVFSVSLLPEVIHIEKRIDDSVKFVNFSLKSLL